MRSINVDLFQNLSATALMIKIWEFSEHVHHKPPSDPSSCNCQYYLDCCIEAARQIWNNDIYIFFYNALYRFQFHRKHYFDIMSMKNELSKEYFV